MKQMLFSFLLLWCLPGSAGSHQPVIQAEEVFCAPAEHGCTLPNVSGLQIIEAGSTYLIVEWNSVLGAAYYRVQTFDAVNYEMAFNRLYVGKEGVNKVTIPDLIPGVEYLVSVLPVCANGQDSY